MKYLFSFLILFAINYTYEICIVDYNNYTACKGYYF